MRVATGRGVVEGAVDGTLARFLGVPYAAAPVGALRFAAPAPHPGWTGVRPARSQGATPLMPPASTTSSIPEPVVPGDEILNLNITAPTAALADGDRLPVYVWIHGGSYVAGSPGGGWFDGASLAGAGAVVVSITYRLGFEGFGHLPGAPDNRGVRDCLAALEWVRDNIASFGGDPSAVTIGGQSAGAGLVLSLLASPAGRGLFRAAISHSAPLPDIDRADAERVAAQLARVVGTDAWRDVSRERLAAGERELATGSRWHELDELRRALVHRGPMTRFGPVVGTPLVPHVLAALAQPDGRRLLLGSTAHEFNPATAPLERPLGGVTPAALLGVVGLPAALARAYPRAYPELSTAQLLGQALTDSVFRSTVIQVAQARAGSGTPAAVWDFRWHPQGALARHCIDLPFAWDVLDGERVPAIAGDRPPQHLAREMSHDVARFVAGHGYPWPVWTPQAPVAKVYDTSSWVGRDPYRFERLAEQVR